MAQTFILCQNKICLHVYLKKKKQKQKRFNRAMCPNLRHNPTKKTIINIQIITFHIYFYFILRMYV